MQTHQRLLVLKNFISEKEFMGSFWKGEKRAFIAIHDLMYARLKQYVEIRVKSPFDEEDILANVFSKLFTNRSSVRSTFHMKRWIFYVIRREVSYY